MDNRHDHRYLRAGIAYVVLGLLVMLITVATPGFAQQERLADLAHLAVALPFFLLFGAFIARGDRALAKAFSLAGNSPDRASHWGLWWREKIVMVLTVTSAGRLLVFAANGFGKRPRLEGGLRLEEIPARPRMFLAALLMAAIAAVLAEASWAPFLDRLQKRET